MNSLIVMFGCIYFVQIIVVAIHLFIDITIKDIDEDVRTFKSWRMFLLNLIPFWYITNVFNTLPIMKQNIKKMKW